MSQTSKAVVFRVLKAAGIELPEHYRNYSEQDLRRILAQHGLESEIPPEPSAPPGPDPMAGRQAYSGAGEDEPIRVEEETGIIWFRDEVRKPATPQPRARRKLTYVDSGVKNFQLATQDGDRRYIETFEVAGDEQRTAEVKITLPSYQVGVYKDPRFPFRIHIYNGNKGFDIFDVNHFYGGSDMVPDEIKRTYVGNDLCYDIRTTIRAIQAAYRRLQLNGGI